MVHEANCLYTANEVGRDRTICLLKDYVDLTTGQILKERFSVLAVIVACLALVVVTQQARQFFVSQAQQPTATPVVAAPTPHDEPRTAQATPRPTAIAASNQRSTQAPAPSKPINLTGKWAGFFSETIDGNTYQYRYILELSQQGNFVSGKSTIEKEDDPNAFAKFVIRGQITQSPNGPAVKIAEDLVGAQKLRTGSAVGPRTTQLSYFLTEGQEYLEGEWVDRRSSIQNIVGTVTLTKQP